MSTPRSSRTTPRATGADLAFQGTTRFELRRVLGEGGMGVVYEALDRERDTLVALKTVRVSDASSLYRLKTEFRACADLEHRNLVRLGELHQVDGHWFFTMELVDGVGFVDHVRSITSDVETTDHHRPITITDTLDTPLPGEANHAHLRAALLQLAQGLEVLHRAGKVHRDLKPSNVMVTRSGRVVILDFGLVRDSLSHQSSDSALIGTAAYMAPEQAVTPSVGAAADLYSLGVMLFEALTGRLPFEGRAIEVLMRKQREDAPPVRAHGDAPEDLAQLCSELLAIEPWRRPTASAIISRLTSARTAVVAAPPPPFVGRTTELLALEAALEQVAAGATRTIFVEGESGIGKSALVQAFVARTEGRPDVRAVVGRCYERESTPFKGIDGVVDALARELARRNPVDVALLLTPEVEALARVFPVLRRVPAIARLNVRKPDSPVELRARAFRGLRQLLGALAAHHTLVVVIDDVQWADSDTLALLREILHSPGAPWMLLILTRRNDVGPPPALPGSMRTITLDRLDDGAGRELLAAIAPDRAAEAEELLRETRGHPRFLQELVRYSAGAVSRLDDALWSRVTHLDRTAHRLLELVAVAGAP
ncbi:MAG: protein kinase, partial [Deltaproteobacteria bacterium]|nr:protein kinase [Kofleriaceae bacterium]